MSTERTHALLAPSSASRWLACTPSAKMEDKFPSIDTPATIEGTRAHKWAEYKLCEAQGLKGGPEPVELYDGDPEMEEHAENYADFVGGLVTLARANTPDAEVLTEVPLDLTAYVPEGYGTADAVIVGDGCLYVIDYKYGKGVKVSAEQNPQMKLYALGVLDIYEMVYGIETISMNIYQPRLGNISTCDITVAELKQWAEEVLKLAAEKAFAGEGELVTGSHCRFCRASAVCRQQAIESASLFERLSAKDTATLTNAEVAEVLTDREKIAAWLKSVEDYALRQALAGEEIQGFKLVAGRSVRRFSDADAVEARLLENGYDAALIYKPRELLGISEMEKLVKKSNFMPLLGDLVIKPEGKPTLVPDSDNRPALSPTTSAINDFQSII